MRRKILTFSKNFVKLFGFTFNPDRINQRIIDNNNLTTPTKTIEEMNLESFNNSWFQVGENLKQSYINIANKYNYEHK